MMELAESGTGRDRTPPPRRMPAQTSFVRTEGRLLLWTVIIVLVAAGLVFLVLRLSNTSPQEILGGGDGEPQPVSIQQAEDYDPQGNDGQENPRTLDDAFDGDPQTAWSTLNYKTADFGALKDGVGIYFDLGESREITRIEVATLTAGWEATIRTSDDASTWSTPGESVRVEQTHTFEPSGEHRYWMVWITRLALTRERPDLPYSAEVAEVQFSSR